MKITAFRGLDNVRTGDDQQILKPGDMTEATNVYVDDAGQLVRRNGFAEADAGSYSSAWKGTALQLAVLDGDLVNTDGGAVLHADVGTDRMWYAELPDGRVVYSNGTAMGVVAANGASRSVWGVPVPSSIGSGANTTGDLPAGEYRYALTHRRSADGLQGGALRSGRINVTTGGLAITSIPTLAGHTTQVWITPRNGTEFYYAGSTGGSTYTQTSDASRDVRCPTLDCVSPDDLASILLAVWRGRVLMAVGDVLYATKARTMHLVDVRRDFRKFAGTITAILPEKNVIWVGTTKGLYVIGPGERFDQMALVPRVAGPVVLGSGVRVPGADLLRGNGVAGDGNDGYLCIANRWLTACYADGTCQALRRYRVAESVTEVAASLVAADDGNLSQYIAIPQ